ncbi:hypothetical protein AURDEDRAFT_18858, partial [Auricularia subglabra TFB-10046 SS5]
HVLTVWRQERPFIFRSYVRVWPDAFDDLVLAISGHPVFSNDSQNDQLPVNVQLALTLYRLGHNGNGAGALKVMILCGVGYGTVHAVTNRVLVALCSDSFRSSTTYIPEHGSAEKEEAQHAVAEMSCEAWQGGHLLVDGSPIVLYIKPAFFGLSFFDRKSNYSINLQ